MPLVDTEKSYTTSEAAEKIGGIDAETVRRYCANFLEGRTPAIEAVQAGKQWFISREEVKRFKKDRRDRGRPKKD